MTDGRDTAWVSEPRISLPPSPPRRVPPPKGLARRRRTPLLITIGRWLLVLFLLGLCIPFAIIAGSHR